MSLPTCTPARSAWRFVYNQNPFYLLSALLILHALRLSFADAAGPRAAWGTMAALSAFTLLLAFTAYLIVRWGGVWDDARTLLLVIVLMFLALAVSFDRTVIDDQVTGRWNLLLGYGFCLLVTEGLLAGLRIRLRFWLRLPYYATLAVLFAYPILLSNLVNRHAQREPTAWAILLFSPVSAVSLLSWLPGAWRGPRYSAENGTPWAWPWFPWSLPFMLGCAAALRSYFLTISFETVKGTVPTFESYLLIPPLLAMFVVGLELSIHVRADWPRQMFLLLPCGLLYLVLPTGIGEGPAGMFLRLLLERAASPLYILLCLLVVYYFYAVARRIPGATSALFFALLGLVCVGPSTLDAESFTAPRLAPLLLAAAVRAVQAWWSGRSVDWLLSGACALAALCVAGQGTAFLAHHGFWPAHLSLGLLLATGGFCRDSFAAQIRHLAALVMLAACLAALAQTSDSFGPIPAGMVPVYLAALIATGAGYGWWAGSASALAVAGVNLACCTGQLAWRVANATHQGLGSSFLPFVAGASAFLAGLCISALKMLKRQGQPATVARARRQE